MPDVLSDQYWQEEFDITKDDVERIIERMRKENRSYTLTELVQRIVRGRLEHGKDLSPAALPEWVTKANILSWDAEEKWTKGSHVLVARKEGTVKPYFGIILDADPDTFFIRLDGVREIVKYARVKPKSEQARARYDNVKKAIFDKELSAQRQKEAQDTDEYIEIIMLKHGPTIGSRLVNALLEDNRLITYEDRWFLLEKLSPISRTKLKQLHKLLLTKDESLSVLQMLNLTEPQRPIDHASLFSLHNALLNEGGKLFNNLGSPVEPLWKAIKPSIPVWNQAVAHYYAYDPATYQILIKPGQRLTQSLAERLQELGLYAEVVIAADESEF